VWMEAKILSATSARSKALDTSQRFITVLINHEIYLRRLYA